MTECTWVNYQNSHLIWSDPWLAPLPDCFPSLTSGPAMSLINGSPYRGGTLLLWHVVFKRDRTFMPWMPITVQVKCPGVVSTCTKLDYRSSRICACSPKQHTKRPWCSSDWKGSWWAKSLTEKRSPPSRMPTIPRNGKISKKPMGPQHWMRTEQIWS